MKKKIIMLVLAISLSYGCSTVLTPYKSSFQCPDTDKGKCISIKKAYQESKGLKPVEKMQEEGEKKDADKPADKKDEASDTYQTSLYKRLSGLLDKPVAPVVAPAQVLRILLLGYPGKSNELYMPRYVYIMIEKPTWVLNEFPEAKPE